jgi:hypothetical protein
MLERTTDQVFPIQFSAESGKTLGCQSGILRGFSRMIDFKSGVIETTV